MICNENIILSDINRTKMKLSFVFSEEKHFLHGNQICK